MTGLTPLTIHEYTIDQYSHLPYTGSYVGRFAIRYDATPDGFLAARAVVYDWLDVHYGHVHVTGSAGSPNSDSISIWFRSSGKRPDLSQQYAATETDPRRI